MFSQALCKREEKEMTDGNKTLRKTQEKQNKLIFHHGKYCIKFKLFFQASYKRKEEEMSDGYIN